MASTSNQGPNPNRGRKRRRPSTAAVVAGTVGKVLGTFLLICVITGAILLCFAAGPSGGQFRHEPDQYDLL